MEGIKPELKKRLREGQLNKETYKAVSACTGAQGGRVGRRCVEKLLSGGQLEREALQSGESVHRALLMYWCMRAGGKGGDNRGALCGAQHTVRCL